MARLFYILFVVMLVVSCSGNNPLWYVAPATRTRHSFSIDYATMPHDSFPLHYTVESGTQENSGEYSYSSFRTEGDTVVWEEGIIRLP